MRSIKQDKQYLDCPNPQANATIKPQKRQTLLASVCQVKCSSFRPRQNIDYSTSRITHTVAIAKYVFWRKSDEVFRLSQGKTCLRTNACGMAKPKRTNIVLLQANFTCLENNVCWFGQGILFDNGHLQTTDKYCAFASKLHMFGKQCLLVWPGHTVRQRTPPNNGQILCFCKQTSHVWKTMFAGLARAYCSTTDTSKQRTNIFIQNAV